MDTVFKAAWQAMNEYCSNKSEITLNKKQEKKYVGKCAGLYRDFISEYMSADSNVLDRHKISSIIAIVGSSDDYVQSVNAVGDDKFFLGRYNVPLAVALAFIEQSMNKDLHDFKLIGESERLKLHIPLPTSCNTPYIDSIARILWFEERKSVSDTLRVVELANIFFLIEECTLLKYGVNMQKWVEMKKEQEL